jgi:hypothetical protein
MRLLIATSIVACLLTAPAFANAGSDTMKACAASWKTMSDADKAKTTYKAYSSTCLKNHGPSTSAMAPAAPAGATGQCKDGTYTMAKNHQGACSSHGGVAKWL